ncbi:MAG: hypothetical protein ACYCYF_13485, partial [Anaerolineae bacterium]
MEKKKRPRGCLIGCGAALLILLLLCGWMAAVRWGVLEKLGLRESVAERVFAGPPDREAAAALTASLQAAGMNTQGVSVHVLPMTGYEGSAAIVVLDASKGFDLDTWFGGGSTGGFDEGTDDAFDPDTLEELGVTRLAFDYVDSSGKSIVTLTAATEDLAALREGEGEDDAEDVANQRALVRSLKGRIDIPGLIREV